MSRFNLSDWSLKHQSLVLYFMLLLSMVGTFSYGQLGQSEDPPFSFKVMVIKTLLPGANANEVAMQVTDPIEKKLQELAALDNLRSFSRAGESTIILWVKEDISPQAIPDAWYEVRKKIGDIRHTLPNQVKGPFFNDEFGDVYGNMYALIGEGYSPAELKRQADRIRAALLQVKDVSKVRFFGEQAERVIVEVSNAKLATLGISTHQLISEIQAQNLVTQAGEFNTAIENIKVRVTGEVNTLDKLNHLYLSAANGQRIRLRDVATVKHGYEDPPTDAVRYMGKPALFIGVSMRKGGDIIALGKHLSNEIPRIEQQLPVGLSLNTITSQPKVVKQSIQEFVKTLAEAVIIVLAVSLLSLGWRTGIVVAIVIPVVLAITFLSMYLLDIGLHKISLGALILALGLLVDDAIIAVEMMASKMEQGMARAKAAAYAYQTTAMPMLSGTLVTAAGFLPIATAASTTGEYTRSIFQVTVIALMISWIAAVVFVPYLGFHLLPDLSKVHKAESNYQGRWYQRLRKLITWVVQMRWIVIALTLLIFALAIGGFGKVQQQFFPDSTRPELLVDLRLNENASYYATNDTVLALENWLDEQIAEKTIGIDNYVAYVGTGSPRFYLPMDQQLQRKNFAEFVITAKNSVAREVIRSKLIALFNEQFPQLQGSVFRLENGPPVGFPVQFRVSGPADFENNDYTTLRQEADKVARVMRENPYLRNVQFDWSAPIKTIQIQVDEAKAKMLGLNSALIANFVNSSLDELSITEYRYRNKRIDLVVRGTEEERQKISRLGDLMIKAANNQRVPLSQIAKLHYTFEEGLIWKRDRVPTITVRANVYADVQAPFVSSQIEKALEPIKAELPLGFHIATGGAIEESLKGSASVAKGAPLFIVVVLTILMLQLQSFSRVLLVLLTAPLGIIGVTLFLLLFNQPFGFVAMLGTIALSGMIMRNAVILVEQISQDQAAGMPHWEAIVESTVRRFRPIVLTAAASILAMIPLSRSAFFGPMAVAIMGGLFVATILTIVALPAIYAAWYRVKIPKEA